MIKNRIFHLLASVLSFFCFGTFARLLGIQTNYVKTTLLSLQNIADISATIQKRFKWVASDYIEKKFLFYPEVLISYRKCQFQGLIFYKSFIKDDDMYIYFGPMFFLDRKAFAFSTFYLLEKLCKQYKNVYISGEIQNPELLIHLQSVMPDNFYPKGFNLQLSDAAKRIIQLFIQNVEQMDQVDDNLLKTTGSDSSLFKLSKRHSPVLCILKRHGIDMENGDALMALAIFNSDNLREIRKSILYKLLTYPQHRTDYLKDVELYMRNL